LSRGDDEELMGEEGWLFCDEKKRLNGIVGSSYGNGREKILINYL
jgi:hypothetical protein